MKNHFPQKIVEKVRQLYYQLKPVLEKKHRAEDYVSFEVESGDYFVGKTSIKSLHKAKKNIPINNFS